MKITLNCARFLRILGSGAEPFPLALVAGPAAERDRDSKCDAAHRPPAVAKPAANQKAPPAAARIMVGITEACVSVEASAAVCDAVPVWVDDMTRVLDAIV
jgi:hypothetical protein